MDASSHTSEISADMSETSLQNMENNVEPHEGYRKRDLSVRLFLFLTPLLVVLFVLLGFMFWGTERVEFFENQNPELPCNYTNVPRDSFYTMISPARVALVSSWASHAAFFVMAPFMIFSSYVVARDVSFQNPSVKALREDREMDSLVHGLLKGAWQDLWTWLKFSFRERKSKSVTELRGVHVAAAGMIIAILFVGLLLAGENWLHNAVSRPVVPQYSEPWKPSDWSEYEDHHWSSSYIPIPEYCNKTIFSSYDQFAPSDLRPCSLNQTTELYGLANAELVYDTLESGISDSLPAFNYENIISRYLAGTGAIVQVVTYLDPNTNLSHAFLIDTIATMPYNDAGINMGVDFVATTTSMATTCTPITQACHLYNATDSDNGNFSIPFNCSSMFQGDLNVAPTDGIEQFKGWNTSFYAMSNGSPRNISVASQLNPFLFNVTAAVISTDFADFDSWSDPDALSGAVVDAGNNRVAFALSCAATVYDVRYSLINGSISLFNATPSNSSMASILKAPLQVGFGRHNLFQSASLAVLNYNVTVAEAMATSFSQVGMALAIGAFGRTLNQYQRHTANILVTRVPKAPLCFIVVVCLSYSLLGIALFSASLWLHRVESYKEVQVELLPREPVDVRGLLWSGFSSAKNLAMPDKGWMSLAKPDATSGIRDGHVIT